MCNLYSITTNQAAIIALFGVANRYVGNRNRAMGAMAVIRYARKHGTERRPWLGRLMERRPTKVAAFARQQDCADGLGHHRPGREIQGTETVAGGMTRALRKSADEQRVTIVVAHISRQHGQSLLYVASRQARISFSA